ncbi:MAG: hypothetical protein HGA86_03840 [Anaerolineaceae bacterium]|nr:hypothetical protein [Anaerolineaceae bacterium]
MEPLAKWRENGGIVVSDDLGSKAVRRFFDPNNQSFDGRQIARNAFLAGNDLLYIDNLVSTGDPDSYTTILRTLEYFKQKYIEDPVFAQKVDQAVERILTLKYRMYPVFTTESIIPQEDAFQKVGQSSQVSFEVARKAVTLINPTVTDLDTILPKPPDYGENIVFLTDTTIFRQCSTCMAQPVFPVDAFQNVVTRNYGPIASGQIYAEFMSSYSFEQLNEMLNSPSLQVELENDIRKANWVIVSFTAQTADRPASSAFQRMLNERPDLLRNKKIIAFSFGTPYYLDSTDISKITAYYSLYSKSPSSFDVAVRILFRELTPHGSLPVSVPAIGYDLIVAMSPDPDQVIQLFVDTPISASGLDVTPVPSDIPTTFRVGDVLPLRTGEILDHNGNPVPDGTVVRFQFVQGGDVTTVQQVDTITTSGIARVTYHIQVPGLVEIRASSDPADVSAILSLNVTTEGGMVTAQAPTPEPTSTTIPTTDSTVNPTQAVTGTGFEKPLPGILFWLLSLVFIGGLSAAAYQYGNSRSSLRWGLRYALLSLVCGVFALFIILVITLATLRTVTFGWGLWIIFVGVLGGLTGCLVGMFWHRRTLQN